MPIPAVGQCAEGIVVDEPYDGVILAMYRNRPRTYLGKRVADHGPFRNQAIGGVRRIWFLLNNTVSSKLVITASLQIVPCRPAEGTVAEAVEKKAVEQAFRDVYETKTGQSATPGTGPADYIRGFAGINVPRQSGTRRMKGGVIPEIGEHVSGVIVDNNKPFKAWSLAQQARGPRTYLGKRVEPRGPLATGNQTNYPAKLLWFEKDGVVTPLWVIKWSLKTVDEYQPDTKRPKTARGRTSIRKTLRKRK